MHPEQFTPLLAIFVILIIAVVLASILRTVGGGKISYERREKLFTPAERSFLGVLEQVVGTQYRVFGKIRLADIVRTPKGLSNNVRTSAFNRICSKHVDFALCDPRTFEIIGVIELDDSSHATTKRQGRDRFIEATLASAGVRLVRILAQRAYAPAEIRERVSVLFSRS
jgi:hypothetical protein